ncbi:MAG: MTH938/NDUFAF3 family protein [Pseudomonadota bacterium]
MELTLHRAPGNAVRRIDAGEVQIGEQIYRSSLLVSSERLDSWAVQDVQRLDRSHAQGLLAWEPALVLIGSGTSLQFPPAEFSAALLSAGVGLETMDSAAACRTYNVLLDEGRAALLGLVFAA